MNILDKVSENSYLNQSSFIYIPNNMIRISSNYNYNYCIPYRYN